MTAKVWAFYAIGLGLLITGLIAGIFGGFNSTVWWLIGVGALSGVVGLLIQLGILNPPEKGDK